MDPRWLYTKVVAQKGRSVKLDAMMGWIGQVSHHLGSLVGAIELTVLHAFVYQIGYFDA